MKNNSGIISLPLILIVSGLIAELAIAGTLIAVSISGSSLNKKISVEAYALAKSGVEDGILIVKRNCAATSDATVSNCFCGSGCPVTPVSSDCDDLMGTNDATNKIYKLSVNSRTVCILLKGDESNKSVIAGVNISGRVARFQADLSIESNNLSIKTFKECYNYDKGNQVCQ